MIARRPSASLLLLAALTAALRAAPAPPPPGIDPKSTQPTELLAAEKKLSVPLPASIPAAGAPPAANRPVLPAATPSEPATAKPDESAAHPSAPPAPGAIKPGILSAVKAKGPPPASKNSAAPVPLSPRFQQIRTKIVALFDARNAPPAPPDPRANPFRPIGAVPLAPPPTLEVGEPAPVAANVDLTSLQQAVATLRVKGTVQRGKSMQLVITSAPGKEGTYKEGDIINVVLPPGDPVHVRVRQISAHSVTLSLNDAEMTLKF